MTRDAVSLVGLQFEAVKDRSARELETRGWIRFVKLVNKGMDMTQGRAMAVRDPRFGQAPSSHPDLLNSHSQEM
jgi:hypothetical protein